MEEITNKIFGGERPLFARHDLILDNVTFEEGESALKACSGIVARKCEFRGKYPFWHTRGFKVKDCRFTSGARAALWYSSDCVMNDCVVDAPKMFRELDGLVVKNVDFPNAEETLWHCRNVSLDNVCMDNADYLFMHSENINIDHYRQNGNYSFQYCKNVTIRNAVIHSKDAFWNTCDVTVYDSEIAGEYLGWHSRRLKLVNCRISGTQPLCYAHDLVMVDCEFAPDCDLAFEDSELDAVILSHVTSIKNPRHGVIKARSIGETIIDGNILPSADCRIITG